MKKAVSLFLTAMLFVLCMCTGSAADETVKISYVRANLPYITVNARLGNPADLDDVRVVMDGKELKTTNVEKYDFSKHSTRIFMLIDLSTSIKSDVFQKIKDQAKSVLSKMNEKTEVVLITFGTEVQTVCISKSSQEIREKIDALKNDKGGTLFFAALETAINQSKQMDSVDMEYALVFSDGGDFQTGNTTQNEIQTALSNMVLPIYAVRTENNSVSKEDINTFREIAKMSGGNIISCTAADIGQKFQDFYSQITDQYIIKAQADSNQATEKVQSLYIKCGSTQSETVTISARSSADNTAPNFLGAPTISEKDNSFTFCVSENISALDGSEIQPDNILLSRGKGRKVEVRDVIVTNDGNNYMLTLVLKEHMVTGDYSIRLENVTDVSVEKNAFSQELSFTCDQGINPVLAWVLKFWYVFVILFAALLIFFILLLLLKKKNVKSIKELFVSTSPVECEVKHIVAPPQGKKIKLYIDYPNGSHQEIVTDIVQSAMFGRSEMCNVVFQDAKMSRQHFCIGCEGDKFVITDLETTNGTYVNGVRVSTPQVLYSGDKIFAGTSTITVSF